jgi:hypothetical protein
MKTPTQVHTQASVELQNGGVCAGVDPKDTLFTFNLDLRKKY